MSGTQPPAIPVFYAGATTTPQLNVMSSAFSFLLNKVAFRARRVATGTVTLNAQTPVPWDTIDEDPYGGWAAGSPTRYTAQAPGWYLVAATCSITGTGAAGWLMIPACAVNGASPTGQGGAGWEGVAVFPPTAAGDPKVVNGAWEVYLNAGDTVVINLFVSNEPAANFTWNTTAGQQTHIEIVWMGV